MNNTRYGSIGSGTDGFYVVDLYDDKLKYPHKPPCHPVGTVVRYTLDGESVRVDSVVAHPSTALAGIWLALGAYGVITGFDDQVREEVAAIVESPGIDDPALEDLTDLPFVTIDNVDSRDLDQAMHIEADDQGFTLRYALADAAHFVRYGSALFEQALRRGSSYYVPGFAVPMLPRELSEDLVSLNEGVVRRALVFEIRFDHEGDVLDTTVRQARIQSAAKLSYTGVESYYQDPSSSSLSEQSYTSTLDALKLLGRLRIDEARKRNVVEYNRNSVEISLDENGEVFEITDTNRLQVEKYNEQISLICNAEGARLLESVGLPSIVQPVYRVHEAPDEERLKKFSRLLKGLIHHYQLPAELWVWRWRDGGFGKREYLADYLARLASNDVDAGLLAAVQRHALMLSPASRFSAEAGGHHSLKLDQYARFSSPMREIAGVYTHREYLQYLAYHKLTDDADDGLSSAADETLKQQVIDAANRSKEVQKKLNKAVTKIAIDQLFSQQLDCPVESRTSWSGTVMSLRSTRVYVQLDSPCIAVKVYLRELEKFSGVKYRLDKSSAVTKGDDGSVIAVGQALELQVQGYTEDRSRWTLVPV